MRVKITLACTECKQRNYNMMKEKEESSRENGDQEVLSFLQDSYDAQRNQVILRIRKV